MLKQLLVAVSVCVALGASAAQAATILFTTTLAPEVAGSLGSGSALVTVDTTANTLQIVTSFANLTGTTTVAHIHCCVDAPGTAGVATYPGTFPGFPAGVTSGTYTSTGFDLGDPTTYTATFRNNFGGGTAAGAGAALLAGMSSSRAYVNIHTSFAPGGEIRGFLSPAAQTPEPVWLALFAVGLAAGATVVRRRRR